MTSRQQDDTTTTAKPRRDKLASMAESKNQSSAADEMKRQEEERQKLKERCQQRSLVWKDLDRAQAKTIQLLDIAQETTQLLGSTDDGNSYPRLSTLSNEFSETLQELYGTLEPHAHFVKAYTNDNEESEQMSNRLYSSRVDMRIAQSRKTLLQEMVELEKGSRGTASENTSRK